MEFFTLKKWDSCNELLDRLRASKSLILGSEVEGLREFYSVALEKSLIGICSQGFGLKPCLVKSVGSGVVFAGYNQAVAGIVDASCDKVFDIDLGSPFYEFVELNDTKSLIAIHELGAMRVSEFGNLIWRADTSDVVESANLISENCLSLNLMEGETLLVNVETGQIEK